ncbi:hypothetical protein OGAPHI_006395 [Ogataea philodendri]|uniref:Uncharacterized protein n=1 Tax=Ogataea philodendri TaxID=1378263 RepID=A0A9P8NXU3_9ASCO|nr:uncharacterized protein OGAPHI_006395 [Ogataea philodendri]KAH3661547.1 hypothetical protein OGAPHI_006395 [Ogataea philodendri]
MTDPTLHLLSESQLVALTHSPAADSAFSSASSISLEALVPLRYFLNSVVFLIALKFLWTSMSAANNLSALNSSSKARPMDMTTFETGAPRARSEEMQVFRTSKMVVIEDFDGSISDKYGPYFSF